MSVVQVRSVRANRKPCLSSAARGDDRLPLARHGIRRRAYGLWFQLSEFGGFRTFEHSRNAEQEISLFLVARSIRFVFSPLNGRSAESKEGREKGEGRDAKRGREDKRGRGIPVHTPQQCSSGRPCIYHWLPPPFIASLTQLVSQSLCPFPSLLPADCSSAADAEPSFPATNGARTTTVMVGVSWGGGRRRRQANYGLRRLLRREDD